MTPLQEIEAVFDRLLPGKAPYDYQRRCWESILSMEPGSGLFIEAQTAGGKTEAAILPVLTSLSSRDYSLCRRLIYVLPTKSLVNAIEGRIRRMCMNIGADLTVRVDYGGSADPTPMFYGDVIVCTWDCFFYGYAGARVLGSRHELPIGNIVSSFIVFDEVHMLQGKSLYSIYLLSEVLNQLRILGVPFVVMTATIASKVKELLVFDDDIEEGPKQSDSNKPLRNRVEILSNLSSTENGLDELLQDPDILELIERSERVLIVADTVRDAVGAYRVLRNMKLERILLHSRLTRKTRSMRENIIHQESSKPLLLVATQVVEAGLNVDFKLVITQLAPVEALIQRLGRAGRRVRDAKAILCRYPGAPYDAGLINAVENMLSRDLHGLERALLDTGEARALIDRQYETWGKLDSMDTIAKVSLDLVKDMLWEISPLKPPSERTLLKAREDVHVTLIVPESINWIEDGAEIDPKDPSRLFDRSFNTSFSSIRSGRRRVADALMINGRGPWELVSCRDKKGWKVLLRKDVRPWSTYLINPDFYARENGEELGVISLWKSS
ncbi:CRISPR-associated helicase Cas3' [Candidatus Bathyarchaeota archaeon]|nr:CRISPR-associated helicase Cas3' [Candidatus Bathyarchaeota archaeon]